MYVLLASTPSPRLVAKPLVYWENLWSLAEKHQHTWALVGWEEFKIQHLKYYQAGQPGAHEDDDDSDNDDNDDRESIKSHHDSLLNSVSSSLSSSSDSASSASSSSAMSDMYRTPALPSLNATHEQQQQQRQQQQQQHQMIDFANDIRDIHSGNIASVFVNHDDIAPFSPVTLSNQLNEGSDSSSSSSMYLRHDYSILNMSSIANSSINAEPFGSSDINNVISTNQTMQITQ
jgi:hypothetical protein